MEEAGILENLALLTPLLPDFEPGPKTLRAALRGLAPGAGNP
jgi:hypothetical protein